MAVTILVLGSAVAGVYSTGVTLGARIAPSDADEATAPAGGPDAPGDGREGAAGTSSPAEEGEGSLPDRVEGDGAAGAEADPTTTDGGGDDSATVTRPDTVQPVEPYPGLWPYVSWREVAAHAARGDTRFRTPTDTALRFATDVVGLTGAAPGRVTERGVVATVEVRSGQGRTRVELTHATPGRTSAATPWSVVSATGAPGLDVPGSARGATVRVRTDGRPGVVGVHDRSRWRGVGVAPAPGAAFDLRIDPGPGGLAIALAVAGDPRAPSSFTVRRITLGEGAGAAAPAAPADPLAATRALVDTVARGDVGATWELLDPAARRSVLDWRGLAGRIPALRSQLGRFASGSFTTTSVTTPAGTVAVVAPAVDLSGTAAGGPLAALAFRVDGGARLASTEAGSVRWNAPTPDAPGVLASGATRPLALVIDGAVWSSSPEGATGLRVPTGDLAPGAHLAIAVSVRGGQVTASAYPFLVSGPEVEPDGPPAVPGGPAEAADLLPEAPAPPEGPGDGTEGARGTSTWASAPSAGPG